MRVQLSAVPISCRSCFLPAIFLSTWEFFQYLNLICLYSTNSRIKKNEFVVFNMEVEYFLGGNKILLKLGWFCSEKKTSHCNGRLFVKVNYRLKNNNIRMAKNITIMYSSKDDLSIRT